VLAKLPDIDAAGPLDLSKESLLLGLRRKRERFCERKRERLRPNPLLDLGARAASAKRRRIVGTETPVSAEMSSTLAPLVRSRAKDSASSTGSSDSRWTFSTVAMRSRSVLAVLLGKRIGTR